MRRWDHFFSRKMLTNEDFQSRNYSPNENAPRVSFSLSHTDQTQYMKYTPVSLTFLIKQYCCYWCLYVIKMSVCDIILSVNTHARSHSKSKTNEQKNAKKTESKIGIRCSGFSAVYFKTLFENSTSHCKT